MRVRDRIVVISLVLLSTATASSRANYISGDATLPRDAMLSGSRSDTHTSIRIGESKQQRSGGTLRSPGPPLPNIRTEADGNDTIREKKTLAVLILMLRDGRGAR